MTRGFEPVLLLIILVNPVIAGTFYRILPNLRAVAHQKKVLVHVRSKFECAVTCRRDENCVLANYGSEDFVCELISVDGGLSHFSEESTGDWQIFGKYVGRTFNCLNSKVLFS